jgi:hypothetical protein
VESEVFDDTEPASPMICIWRSGPHDVESEVFQTTSNPHYNVMCTKSVLKTSSNIRMVKETSYHVFGKE